MQGHGAPALLMTLTGIRNSRSSSRRAARGFDVGMLKQLADTTLGTDHIESEQAADV